MVRACLATFTALAALMATCRERPPAPEPKAADEALRIRGLEERRSTGNGELVALVRSGDPAVRRRALWAMGRIQDPASRSAIQAALSDGDASVRAEAAFAAGLLAQSWEPLPDADRTALLSALLDAEAKEADLGARSRLLEAIGKCGTEPAASRLRERLGLPDPELRARAALSLGIMGRREGKLDDRSVVAAFGLMSKDAPRDVRYGGAYALAFSKVAEARPALVQCLEDADPDVRSLCARGLGEVGAPEDVPALAAHLEDADYRPAAEAARALAKMVERCAQNGCAALDALGKLDRQVMRLSEGDSTRAQALVAVAQQGLPASGRATLEALFARIGTELVKAAPPTRDACWVHCRYAAALDRLDGALARTPGCGSGQVAPEERLALGLRELARGADSAPPRPDRSAQLAAYLDSPAVAVRDAALDALSAFKAKDAAPKIRPLISSSDDILAGDAAAAAAAIGDRAAFDDVLALVKRMRDRADLAGVADALAELAKPLDAASPADEAVQKQRARAASDELHRWLTSPEPSVRIAAAQSLSKLLGHPLRAPFVEGRPPRAFPKVPEGASLAFATAKGRFVVRLDAEENPLTSANLFGLARRGFFDGLTFHRVVPDFVAQGGDPRGDGEGGPGYTLPCEIGHRTYSRGSFGMALSGKDTGGSQFFVTVSPQPHLDGRYTRFGEVTSGMDVVDRLLEGERILRVEALP